MVEGWRAIALVLAGLATGFPGQAFAQDVAGAAPEPSAATEAGAAPSEVPELIETSAFASRAAFFNLAMSGKGTKFALTVHKDEKDEDGEDIQRDYVILYDAGTRKPLRVLPMPGDRHVNSLSWAGDDRLLMSLANTTQLWGNLSVPVTRLLMHDHAKGTISYVGREKQGLAGDDIIFVDPDGDYILLSSKKGLRSDAEVHKVLLDGTRFEDTAVRVQKTKGDSDTWYADNAGVVRLGVHYKGNRRRIWYRSGPEEDWDKVASFRNYEDDAKYWDVINISAGSDTGLVLAKADSGRVAIREFDFREGELGRVVYEHPQWDVESASFDRNNRLIAAYYTDDRDRVHWFDEDMANWQDLIEEALPQTDVFFTQRAADGSRMIVWAGGEHDPGSLLVFTPDELDLGRFMDVRPEIDFRQLVRPRAIRYTARDGLEIPGYLALPRGREPKDLPLIIMPHGGPYGVRDQLRYDDEVQLLANRGYAVLQPNYRGSGGYGDDFEEAGYGQIGRTMQDDIDDAMDWAVGEGIADPARICVVGASYGGFAAMWAVIRNPERYRCAASWAGVTDWLRIMRYDKQYLGRRGSKRLRAKLEGIDQEVRLRDLSPVDYGENLTRPLLLAHGKKDGRVPLEQYEKMADRTKDAPGFETLLLEDSGHSFAHEEDEQAWYDRLLAFLAKHNPSARNPAPAAAAAEPAG
jgi:dipeptidyl aminopeptidase/acylaminoacyl peptidase